MVELHGWLSIWETYEDDDLLTKVGRRFLSVYSDY